MKNVVAKILPHALVMFFVVFPFITYADATGFFQLAPTPSGHLNQIYNTQGDLSTFINGLFKFALSIGAIAAVLRLAYAGYLYMGQADMWSHKGEAKKIIGDVTLGLLILLGIWLILNQINPDILKLNALRNITPAGSTAPATQQAPTTIFSPQQN
jgi:hypothetical protein